jgi:hypothetical protein
VRGAYKAACMAGSDDVLTFMASTSEKDRHSRKESEWFQKVAYASVRAHSGVG